MDDNKSLNISIFKVLFKSIIYSIVLIIIALYIVGNILYIMLGDFGFEVALAFIVLLVCIFNTYLVLNELYKISHMINVYSKHEEY